MANGITHRQYGDEISIRMNNGITECFFVSLALSSSALAQTPDEERLALWIAQHDQTVRGYGSVSFDLGGGVGPDGLTRLSAFPWTYSQFVVQKVFLLSAIDDALSGDRRRRTLSFELAQDVVDKLAKFLHMVKRCREQYLEPETPYTLLSSDNPPERCIIHGVLLHEIFNSGDRRCIVCNAYGRVK